MAKAKMTAKPAVEAFSIGDPEPVLNRRDVLSMLECTHNGRWYETPVNVHQLARAYRVGPHHESAINFKNNVLQSYLVETDYMSLDVFDGLALDYLTIGNVFAEQIQNRRGGLLRVERSIARYTRRGVKPGVFFNLSDPRQPHEFEPGAVVQMMRADVSQEIYGLPEYLGALQSAFLNEAATLFRRKYYLNGSHVGYILRSTDANMTQDEVDALKANMKAGKGPGNFRNLFIHSPGGKEKGIEIHPISEVAAKDEFLGIKNTTRDDVLAAHRVPPQLLGIVPANAGGFGDVDKAAIVFERNEIKPIQNRFLSMNRKFRAEVFKFRPFAWELAANAA